jgi:hypothetical protein
MSRPPEWLYRLIERAYLKERGLRREEERAELERQDKAAREFYDRLREEHKVHEALGRRVPDCPYVPCVRPVGWGVR